MSQIVPITYRSEFFDQVEADALFVVLRDQLDWKRHDKVPRSEYYCEVAGRPYNYGTPPHDRTYEAQSWSNGLVFIKQCVEEHTGTTFEAAFLNRYHDQSDQLGWHADDSIEMDDKRPIAIISFGVEREIWFRRPPINGGKCLACNGSGRYDHNGSPVCSACNGTGRETPPEVTKLKLEHGSLCLMHAGMQHEWQHRIPKAGFTCGERISITLRGMK